MKKMIGLVAVALCSCFVTACQPTSSNTVETQALEKTELVMKSNDEKGDNSNTYKDDLSEMKELSGSAVKTVKRWFVIRRAP